MIATSSVNAVMRSATWSAETQNTRICGGSGIADQGA
jgi:hypothetical protein